MRAPAPDPADDPDALWKPGYTGGYRTPDPSGAPTPAGRAFGRTFGGVGALVVSAVLALLVVAALVAVGTSRDRSDPTPPAPWSATFDTVTVGAVATSPETVAVLLGRPGEVVVLDRRDGSERWRRSAPGDSATGLDVVMADEGDDGVVVVRHVDADGLGSALALDLDTGTTRWRWALAVGERVDVVGDDLVRRSVRATPNGPAGTTRLDPLSGDARETLDGPLDDAITTDNVLRNFGSGGGSDVARLLLDVEGGDLELAIDLTVAATTVSFTPATSEIGTVAP